MPIPKGEFDGNAPAFGKDEQEKSDSKSAFTQFKENVQVITPAEAPAEKVENKEKPPRQEEDEDKKVIPYERFQKTNRKLAKALEELEDLKASQLVKTETQKFIEKTDLPRWWADLYGDNEASKKGYQVWHENEQARQQEVEDKILKTIQERESLETQAVKKEEQAIDDEFDSFETEKVLELTDKERIEVLNIIDEFTPKDDEGNYLGATIPVEKAYEIYELKHSVPSQTTQQRKALAGITGGGGSGKGNSAQTFRPGDWGGWRRVVGR